MAQKPAPRPAPPEKVEAVQPAVAGALKALALDPPAPVRAAVAEGLARVVTESDEEAGESGDITHLTAAQIVAAFKAMGEPVPGSLAQIEARLEASGGEPNVRPEGILTPEEEEARQQRLQAIAQDIMAAPNSKRANYLRALKESKPCTVYSPVDDVFHINSVTIIVVEGENPPKKRGQMPRTGSLGCEMIADIVRERRRMASYNADQDEKYRSFEFAAPDVPGQKKRVNPGGVF
jgi:hypothetical protein